MKIVWSVPVPGAGLDSGRGDLVRAARLIAALRGEGHDVRIVHAGSLPRTAAAVTAYRSVVRRLVPGRLALVLRDLGRAVHARAHADQVAIAAREHDADVIIETQVHLSDSGARAAGACGLPLVLDDCSPADEEVTLGAGLTTFARMMFARQVAAAALLTVSSSELHDRLVHAGVAAEKVVVVPNGVDLQSYVAADRDVARARFGFDTGPTLGFVGSFQPWHRVDLLVDALARLTGSLPPRVLLVGDGPGRAPALERARRLGVADRVVAPGALPPADVPLALAACDAAVLPGTNDYGQPMKLLEYAAAGLATVAPDLPTVRALVDHGVTGLLFPAGDARALARAIQHFLDDASLRRRLGAVARRRLGANVDWSARGQALADACARVARPAPAGVPC